MRNWIFLALKSILALTSLRNGRPRMSGISSCLSRTTKSSKTYDPLTFTKRLSTMWRTDTANQRGGEWMGADKNSSRRRWKLQQHEHGFQHTSPTHYPSWPSPRSHWSATGPRNQQTTFRPEDATEHQTSSPLTNTGQTGEHHRSDRSLLVKLGDFH
jgi:hypothetical protein